MAPGTYPLVVKPGRPLSGFTTSGYVPGAISECTYQGKQYCYPIGTNTVGIFYNKKMLAAAGVQPPKSWADLQAAAKAAVYGAALCSGQVCCATERVLVQRDAHDAFVDAVLAETPMRSANILVLTFCGIPSGDHSWAFQMTLR